MPWNTSNNKIIPKVYIYIYKRPSSFARYSHIGWDCSVLKWNIEIQNWILVRLAPLPSLSSAEKKRHWQRWCPDAPFHHPVMFSSSTPSMGFNNFLKLIISRYCPFKNLSRLSIFFAHSASHFLDFNEIIGNMLVRAYYKPEIFSNSIPRKENQKFSCDCSFEHQ